MNILYIDIDSLRPDHLGCYGYHRNTSPNIDTVAADGVRFSNCYVPDAPCLPSRTAMTTGRFGIHTGVVNHGGIAAQPHLWGPDRSFACNMTQPNWANQFREAGYHTVAFSPFAQRHGAWHWYAGFMEMHNTGGGGMETADEISPQVTDWIQRKGGDDKPFFMWVNVWDPHTPYRTPAEFGNPFKNDPLPAWYTEEIRQAHWRKPGPHSPQEVPAYDPRPSFFYDRPEIKEKYPNFENLQPQQIASMDDARKMFDGYDMGVTFADMHVGRILQALKDQGLYENTAIIISADHGENLGELWVYGDHQTADQITHNVPMIVRWPGVTDAKAGSEDDRLHYSIDIGATSLEWAGLAVPEAWDGQSFAGDYQTGKSTHRRDSVVLSQMAWCAQRSARWETYICIETYHDAWHEYPDYMVFDLASDPHEQHNLADELPELVQRGKTLIHDWRQQQMSVAHHRIDPLDTVMSEGGPFHAREAGKQYLERLRQTGRGEAADRLAAKHGC
ncbi:MAG: sulfatase [Opitutales bacterium]